jgi:hypothetical protein
MYSVHIMAPPSTVPLLHRKHASGGTFRYRCRAQRRDKRYNVPYVSSLSNHSPSSVAASHATRPRHICLKKEGYYTCGENTLTNIGWFRHITFRHVRIDAKSPYYLLHVRPSVHMYQSGTKFDSGNFYEYLSRKCKFV